jgi:predicted PurR-regulated permease PerM
MTDSQKWLIIAAILLSAWLIYLLSPVITPFIFSAILAYLFDPLVDRLEQKLPRTIAVLMIFTFIIFIILILLLILIPILQGEILTLLQRLPDLVIWLEHEALPYFSSMLGIDIQNLDIESVRSSLQENWRNIGNLAGFLFVQITSSGQALLTWIAYLLLVPVVSFYLLRDWDIMVLHVKNLLPVKNRGKIGKLALECDNVLSEFLRGQLLVMLSLSIIYAVGLWVAGIEYAVLIGSVSGIISFIPYLGSIVGIAIALVVAFFQYHDVIHLVFVALVFGAGQALEGMVLSPLLVGERIGLHPVAVIFAVMAGGQLFGFTGILMALPIAAVCLVLLRYVYQHYQSSEFYSQ